MKLTAEEKVEIMEAMNTVVYNVYMNTLSDFADGTKEKRKDIAKFLGEYLTETVAANTEYFTKFK